MKRIGLACLMQSISLIMLIAQENSDFIVVDQFGYLPGSRKVAVIRDPQAGFDAGESFHPGSWYVLVDARSGEAVFRGKPEVWNGGLNDESSGDRAWHFDFSSWTRVGDYYIWDQENQLRSFEFRIDPNVYKEVLKQAMRTFFYQRVGFTKEAPYADEGWTDGASHSGDLQDGNCRSFFDKDNPDSERDVSGGWYDAGDYNKYTSWTANYVVELLKAFAEHPEAWGDDYQIPESGNGRPDILDEAIWGIEHLLRMQEPDGAVLSIVGEAHASPPSAASGPSYYGPPNTSATLNTAAAFAMASGVFRDQGMIVYADTLLARALLAWDWAEENPDSLFYNNRSDYGSQGLGAGQQEVDDYGRLMASLEAAAYLFAETTDPEFRNYFEAHYLEAHMMQWNWCYPFEALNQEVLLYYASLDGASPAVRENIQEVYTNSVTGSADNLPAYVNGTDPYLAYTKDYVWGSNGILSAQGSMNYNLLTYELEVQNENLVREAAEAYIHKIHGVNPLNFLYLSNMYDYGGDQGVNEFYHSWFCNNSPDWDRVGLSTYGPPPGFLTGGPNPQYDWDACCPDGCGSTSNNELCYSEEIAPPKGQPDQKSYKDFNTSWPLNSWSVTENSCGYQVRYIRLLSKFVDTRLDCNGDPDGNAFIDSCGVCAGGNTGITPSLDPDACGIADAEGDTLFVEGRYVYTASGERLVLQGVNELFSRSDDPKGEQYLPEIAKTGANCVRLVWSSEDSPVDLCELIENCIGNKMIAMPACHSASGEWDKLDSCIQFWKDPDLLATIQQNRKWTLLDIGTALEDEQLTEALFKEGCKNAIDSLRTWGYSVPLVVSASSRGADVDMLLPCWQEILHHDPLKNILFSFHAYWEDAEQIQRVANEAVNKGLPVILGEGPSVLTEPGCDTLDYAAGMMLCVQNDIGWFPWTWGGFALSACSSGFNLTQDGIFGQWATAHAAQMMADHPFSMMRTSERPASFFNGGTVEAGGIYISPEVTEMEVGDTLDVEVLVSPKNAADLSYTVDFTGDAGSLTYNQSTSQLLALAAGTAHFRVSSISSPEISFTRTIVVHAPTGSQDQIGSENESGLKIYPNPGRETLFLETGKREEGEVRVLSLSGQLMIRMELKGKAEISTRKLSPGTYLVVFLGPECTQYQKLIIL